MERDRWRCAPGQTLLEHFPESGVYSIPANSNDPEVRASLYDQRLTGFVILNVDGRPEMDRSMMASLIARTMSIVKLLLGSGSV